MKRPLSERWNRDLEVIASLHGFTLKRLINEGKFGKLCVARKDCYAYLREQGWSYPEIGGLFNRDHTTVLYALEPEERQRAKNERAMKAYWRKRGIAA
jgi:chromosomal replication initiation ATPase DnaA